MAREEAPKEDLLRQATGLADRVELQVDGFANSIVIGFRNGSAASVFFGEEPAYHWNSAGELRRAYVDGKLLKAEEQRLISLEKKRQDGQVQMIRHEFTDNEQAEFMSEISRRLERLREALCSQGYKLTGQASQDNNDVVQMAIDWITELITPLKVAAKPNIG